MVNKQLLIKETNISKHLHRKESPAPYSESDTTRRLYHTEPLIPHVEMYTKVTRPAVCTTQRRWWAYGTLKYGLQEMWKKTWSSDHVTKVTWRVTLSWLCQPPHDRSRDHKQIEVDIGLCQSLFNQSEGGVLRRRYDNTRSIHSLMTCSTPLNSNI